MQRFPEKTPYEDVVLTFDMSQGLAPGETLVGSPTVTVASLAGGDQNPSAIQNGAAAYDSTSTMILVPVLGGLDMNDYLVVAEGPTSNPLKTLAWSGILPVRATPSSCARGSL